MDISIIVPIYNVEDYLGRCVESLINQTFCGQYEIILVNDGSSDQSGCLAKRYEEAFPELVRYFEKANGGLSDARNYGLKKSEGKYISFIDSDDYVDSSFLQKMFDLLEASNADIAVCSYLSENEESFKSVVRQKGNLSLHGKSVIEEPMLLLVNSPYAWNKVYRRSLFESTGIRYPVGLPYEDIATTYPLMVEANKVVKIEEPLIHYIVGRSGSITGSFTEQKLNILPSLRILVEESRRILVANGLESDLLDNYLFTICARHIYYRLRELCSYKGLGTRLSFIDRAFRMLSELFPAWQHDSSKLELLKWGKIEIADKQFWINRIAAGSLVPRNARSSIDNLEKLFRKAGRISTHRRYLYSEFRKHCPIEDKVALFESFHGREMSDSPLALAKSLANQGEWKVYYSVADEGVDIHYPGITPVELGSVRYLKLLASAKLLVNSVTFPSYFVRRDEQVYLNTWHGTPLKTLGKSMVHGVEDMNNIQRNFLQSTHLMFPDRYTENHIMEDYSLDTLYQGRLVECAYPRNEVFIQHGKIEHSPIEDINTIAFMPTWRGASSGEINTAFLDDIIAVFDSAEKNLRNDQKLVVKLHSLMLDSLDELNYKKVELFPRNEASYDVLSHCDALITDYSSVMFDFALSNKPVALLAPDWKEYESERGAYMSISQLPFPIFSNSDELFSSIARNELALFSRDELHTKLEQFDPVESSRILDDVLSCVDVSYIRSVKGVSECSVIVCDACKTPDDVSVLHDVLVDVKAKLGKDTVVFIRAVDFTDTLRTAVRNNDDGLFNSFVITKGANFMTYRERVLMGFMDDVERHRAQVRRRIARYLPNVRISQVIYLNHEFFRIGSGVYDIFDYEDN